VTFELDYLGNFGRDAFRRRRCKRSACQEYTYEEQENEWK
jgi:hypothetical protein